LLKRNAGLQLNSKINNVSSDLMRAVNATKNLEMVNDLKVKMPLLSPFKEKNSSRVQIKNRLKSLSLNRANLCAVKSNLNVQVRF